MNYSQTIYEWVVNTAYPKKPELVLLSESDFELLDREIRRDFTFSDPNITLYRPFDSARDRIDILGITFLKSKMIPDGDPPKMYLQIIPMPD